MCIVRTLELPLLAAIDLPESSISVCRESICTYNLISLSQFTRNHILSAEVNYLFAPYVRAQLLAKSV